MLTWRIPAGPGLVARVVSTSRAEGDFDVKRIPDELVALRAEISDGPWTWLRQVHGSRVVEVDRPGAMAGSSADAVVTVSPGCVIAVHTADCAPLVLVGDGSLGVVHVGWRGIVAGVIPTTVAALDRLDGRPATALIGPCIRPSSYEFGQRDLDLVAAVAGGQVCSRTADARPALDLAAAVTSVLAGLGIDDTIDPQVDTADPDYFSHRVRGESARQATLAWLEEPS